MVAQVTPLTAQVDDAADGALDAMAATLPESADLFTIAGRQFEVREVSYNRLVQITSLAVKVFKQVTDSGLIDMERLSKIDLSDLSEIVNLIAELWETVPDKILDATILVLAPQSKEDRQLVRDEITLPQVLDVVLAFMDRNPWEDVYVKLFLIQQSAQNVVNRIKAAQATGRQLSLRSARD